MLRLFRRSVVCKLLEVLSKREVTAPHGLMTTVQSVMH